MEICYPDYRSCIANLACSILHSYGVQPPNSTLPAADELLRKEYRNVVILLLDGMGMSTLERHLPENVFLRRNLHSTCLSTFPPTTVAATTAVTSGLFPNQSAWLGWTGYFDEIDRNVVYFLNKDSDTGEKLTDFHVAFTCLPYEHIVDRLRQSGVDAHSIASFMPPFPQDYLAFCAEIQRLCEQEQRKFIYAYWAEPDGAMHKKGVNAAEVHEILQEIERQTEALARELKDTLLIITADHGLIDAECAELTGYPEIMECLVRPPSIESRTVNFFVKPGMQQAFEQAFERSFSSSFRLMKKADVLKEQLFGTGENHPKLERMLGDYLAVGTGSIAIRARDKGHIAEHGGLTAEEMTIPLIAVECSDHH